MSGLAGVNRAMRAAGLALLLFAIPARADWPPTGAPVTEALDLWDHTIAPDGAGGVFVSWSNFMLFASRLTSEGELAPGWPAAGRRIPGAALYNLASVPDGDGGLFIVFNAKDCAASCGANPAERRVVRLTASGDPSPGWTDAGFKVGGGFGPVGFGAGDPGRTVAIPDGEGGLIVAWGRHVGPHRHAPIELRIQRMSGDGRRLWGDSGRVVRSASSTYPLHAIAPDGRGGAFVSWTDEREPRLFAQYVTPDGEPLWATNGIPLGSGGSRVLDRPIAVEDGARGAIIAWFGAVDGDTGVFAVRVTRGGGLPWRAPRLVQRAPGGLDWLQMVPAREGDAILAWRDARVPGQETIHAQRVSHGGRLEWGPRGLPVCDAEGHKDYVALASDDLGGAYLAWGDTRPAGEVFATHLGADGRIWPGWDVNGTPVCPPVAGVRAVKLVGDGEGNAIVVFTDERVPTPGTFRSRMTLAARLLAGGPATPIVGRAAVVPGPRGPRHVVDAAPAPSLALRGASPNPGPPGGLVRFTLPDEALATLELFDVSGRRLWLREVGGLGAGEHAVRLAHEARLPPGVYLLRLARRGESLWSRVAIVR